MNLKNKNVFALLLSLVLCLSCFVPAFAASDYALAGGNSGQVVFIEEKEGYLQISFDNNVLKELGITGIFFGTDKDFTKNGDSIYDPTDLEACRLFISSDDDFYLTLMDIDGNITVIKFSVNKFGNHSISFSSSSGPYSIVFSPVVEHAIPDEPVG